MTRCTLRASSKRTATPTCDGAAGCSSISAAGYCVRWRAVPHSSCFARKHGVTSGASRMLWPRAAEAELCSFPGNRLHRAGFITFRSGLAGGRSALRNVYLPARGSIRHRHGGRYIADAGHHAEAEWPIASPISRGHRAITGAEPLHQVVSRPRFSSRTKSSITAAMRRGFCGLSSHVPGVPLMVFEVDRPSLAMMRSKPAGMASVLCSMICRTVAVARENGAPFRQQRESNRSRPGLWDSRARLSSFFDIDNGGRHDVRREAVGG